MKNEHSPTISTQFTKLIQTKGNSLSTFSTKWNKNENFSKAVSICMGEEFSQVLYKAEHVVLKDLVCLYSRVVVFYGNSSSLPFEAKFSLIYFYEKLQGRDLFQQFSALEIQKMIHSSSFDQNFETILALTFFEDQYKNTFLIPLVLTQLENETLSDYSKILKEIVAAIFEEKQKLSETEIAFLKALEEELNHPSDQQTTSTDVLGIPADDTLEKVMVELNELVGLEEIKKTIEDLTNFLKVQKIREEQGLKSTRNSLHAVFMGPPGTGKTTVARLLGRIYKHLGYLEKGHLIETDRSGLVAGYVGQTALKSDEVIKKASGGVLFIDEAYSLSSNGVNDFGNEAIEILLKRMEDKRNNFVLVVAGYADEMEIFIQSNPGLQSRFNRYFKFKHLEADALLKIFKLYASKADFVLTEDAEDKLTEIIERLCENRTPEFGNTRTMRNIFEKIIEKQANRLSKLEKLDKEILMKIEEEDVPEILKMVQEANPFQEK